ncbi:hypothetical protein D3C87_1763640 [compost metagenome]
MIVIKLNQREAVLRVGATPYEVFSTSMDFWMNASRSPVNQRSWVLTEFMVATVDRERQLGHS